MSTSIRFLVLVVVVFGLVGAPSRAFADCCASDHPADGPHVTADAADPPDDASVCSSGCECCQIAALAAAADSLPDPVSTPERVGLRPDRGVPDADPSELLQVPRAA